MDFAPRAVASSAAMNVIAALLEHSTGQQIAANRTWRIETALKPLLRERGFDTLDALIASLIHSPDGDLSSSVVDVLLNQETSFFRDAGVLEQLIPLIREMRAEVPERRPRIWSAGCSTGQEPLSLAMLFAEHDRDSSEAPPEIVATDVSAGALARARAGRYSQFEIQRGLSVRRMMTWFDNGSGDWVADSELVRRIQFRQHNLALDAPPSGRFDIILCRNVLLYFSHSLRRQVLDRLHEALRPGGVLIMGAGETTLGQSDHFTPCQRYRGIYRSSASGDSRLRSAAG